jgi:GMP synthase (glutamine-hydrolysing)
MKLLVVDAYPDDARAALLAAGATPGGELYVRRLVELAGREDQTWLPGDVVIHLIFPSSDADVRDAPLPLEDYDGVVVSGSSFNIYDDDPRIVRQIELVRELFERGVPCYGSCWAAQLATVAAGGRVERNSRGREFGIARVRLTESGSRHPLLRGRPDQFSVLQCHEDQIVELAPGSVVLAENETSPVQAIAIEHGNGVFWAVQYHPEFDLREIVALSKLRAQVLVEQGTFEDAAALERYRRELTWLHNDPGRVDLADKHGAGKEVLDAAASLVELRNWVEDCVTPRSEAR